MYLFNEFYEVNSNAVSNFNFNLNCHVNVTLFSEEVTRIC